MNKIKLISEEGEELIVTEVMELTMDQDIGSVSEGTSITIYKDDENTYYPLIRNEEDESLQIINDQEVLDAINDTLEILENEDEVF